jgi:uncharacterized membrane protein
MPARTQTADLLKGIAALLMIQVHLIELFASKNIADSTTGKLLLFLGGPPVAPVFLFFLGYFIATSQKTTWQLIGRGVKIIILGLALNTALNLNLIISVFSGRYIVDILPYLFGVDVLPHAGLCILFIAVMKKVLNRHFLVPLILAFIAAIFGEVFLEHVPQQPFQLYTFAFFYGDGWWSYFPLFPWFSYSLAGIAFYKLSQQFDFSIFDSLKAKFIIGILFCLFLIFTGIYAVSVASDLQVYYHHGIQFFLWVIVFLVFYGFFTNELQQVAGGKVIFNYLEWLGRNITLIYVIQWILIGNIATEIYRTVASPAYLIISFFAILSVSSLIGYGYLRLKAK